MTIDGAEVPFELTIEFKKNPKAGGGPLTVIELHKPCMGYGIDAGRGRPIAR